MLRRHHEVTQVTRTPDHLTLETRREGSPVSHSFTFAGEMKERLDGHALRSVTEIIEDNRVTFIIE